MGAAQYISHYTGQQEVVSVSLDYQNKARELAELECYNYIHTTTDGDAKEGHCNATWDGLLCWPSTSADTLVQLSCPNYVDGFVIQANASRRCTKTGHWYYNPLRNSTWTNYTNCMAKPQDDHPDAYSIMMSQEHLERIKLMYSIGYGISLLALVIAMFIMVYFKRLHCPRNTIHLHLFVAFALRALLSFLKDNLLVNHIGLPNDVIEIDVGVYTLNPEGTHWQCKLLFTTFHYVVMASKFWVFVEGLYLHVLVTITIFSERRFIRWTTLFGWGGPFVFIVPWICIRATVEDVLCWNTHPTYSYFMILKGPQVAIVLINFLFFLNIVRVLCTKLVKSAPPRARANRYRRLGKSTLVLIPILGVHFLITVAVPGNFNTVTLMIKLYYEMLFNSFQGFLIAFLFCFLNEEVQSEVKKRYIRHKMRAHSRHLPNKYVNAHPSTSSSIVRSSSSRAGPSYTTSSSARRDPRESSSHRNSDQFQPIDKQKLRGYIQPMRYYRGQPPNIIPIDAKPIVYTSQRKSYV